MRPPLAQGAAGRGQRMAHLLIKVALHRASVQLSQWSSAHPDHNTELTGADDFEDMISRQRAAAHQRMLQPDYQGSIEELAAALTDAWLWRGDSPLAAETLANLIEVFHDDFGLIIDPDIATVTVDPAVDPGWAEWSNERLSALNRAVSAEKFAKNILSAAAIPPERRGEIDRQLRRWAMSFSRFPDSTERRRMDGIRHDIDAAMQRAAVPAPTRESIHFALIYISGWQPETFDLRFAPVLLEPHLHTAATNRIAPGRNAERDLLRSMLRDYADAAAAMAANADRVADNPELPLGQHITDIDELLARMDRHRHTLSSIADDSTGLHSLERDMIRCLVHEIGHGDVNLPDLLLIDQHSQHLADQRQHERVSRSTLEAAEHRIIAALDAAGTGVREPGNTDAEPIRTTWERTIIHLSALAHRWHPDLDTARAQCDVLANELDQQLTHRAVPPEARVDIRHQLQDTIDFAYHHARDGIEHDRHWTTHLFGDETGPQRGLGAHPVRDNHGRSLASRGEATITTDILDALPAMPHAPWASPTAAQQTAPDQAPERQTGPTL
ncbi:hypothetical protein [Nocardia niwae]|uniref:hypothetical protein n=1 Tax=Nocardia niwae TaxID=626084 RepID=UPI0033FB2DE8